MSIVENDVIERKQRLACHDPLLTSVSSPILKSTKNEICID